MGISALRHGRCGALRQHPQTPRLIVTWPQVCFGSLCLTDINCLMAVNKEGERCRNGCSAQHFTSYRVPPSLWFTGCPNNSCLALQRVSLEVGWREDDCLAVKTVCCRCHCFTLMMIILNMPVGSSLLIMCWVAVPLVAVWKRVTDAREGTGMEWVNACCIKSPQKWLKALWLIGLGFASVNEFESLMTGPFHKENKIVADVTGRWCFDFLFLLEQDSPGMGWKWLWISSAHSGSHPVDGGAVSFLTSPSLPFPWCVTSNARVRLTLTSVLRCSSESEEHLRMLQLLPKSIEKISFWKIYTAANREKSLHP